MDEVSSVACSMTAGSASIAATRDASRSLLRWVVFGAASIALFALALMQSGSVGAQAPIYTTPGVTTTSGNYLVSTYVDPRYCGGVVNIVSEGGVLINRCPNGVRVFPVFPDYNVGFGANFVGANYLNGNFAFNGGVPLNGNFSYLNGNACGFTYCNTFNNGFNNFNNGFNTFPAGGTVAGGVVYYNDNRFCGDGKLAFVPGRGYYCQNGGPLVTNGVNNVNCGNFFFNGCGVWRGFEADAAAPAVAPQQVTAFAAPAAKAPVVAPAAPVVAPAAAVVAPAAPVVAPAAAVVAPAVPVVAPAAPVTAKAATALNAPAYAPVGSSVDFSDRG